MTLNWHAIQIQKKIIIIIIITIIIILNTFTHFIFVFIEVLFIVSCALELVCFGWWVAWLVARLSG